MNDFKSAIFDKCKCPSKDIAPICVNNDTNFQNYLIFLPNEILLILFIALPFCFHLVHSLFLNTHTPVPMIDFILGTVKQKTKENMASESDNDENEIELEALNLPSNMKSKNEESNMSQRKPISKSEWTSLVLGTLIIVGICIYPYSFDYLFNKVQRKQGIIRM